MPHQSPLIRPCRGRSLAALAVAALAAAASAVGAVPAQAATPTHWVGSWTASPQPPTPTSLAAPTDYSVRGFGDETVRQTVHTSAGGTLLRLRFSNAFGTRPLRLGAVTVGLSGGIASAVPGTLRTVTFSGRPGVTLPVGAEWLSDAVPLRTGADSDLVVSTHLPVPTGPATYHSLAQQTNVVADGDRAGQPGPGGFTRTTGNWYFLDGVDVAGTAAASVIAVGDSITDGYGSTPDADNRWPNLLAQRLQAQPGNQMSVVDAGISGNRVLNDSRCFGTNLLSRFDRDVAGQPGASTVILLEGINDIGFSQTPDAGCTTPNTAVSADRIIAGYRQVIARSHQRGLRVLGATLTPFKGADYWSPEAEVKRETVNSFIRTSGEFDGVVDFAAAIKDPAHPAVMAAAYDSGDHLHPNDAGYAAMAAAVPLAALHP